MRYSITHAGVPIGTVDLVVDGGRGDGVVSVLPAYDAIKSLVERATKVLADVRDQSRGARDARRAHFRESAALTRHLELHDENGVLVAADYVVLHDEPGAEPQLHAIGMRGHSADSSTG